MRTVNSILFKQLSFIEQTENKGQELLSDNKMMNKVFSIIFLLSLVTLQVLSACPVTRNQLETIPDNAKTLMTVPNGQKLLIGELDDPLGNYLYIAKLKGTPYEMGKAFGQMFEQQLKDQMHNFMKYYDDMLTEFVKQDTKIPKFMRNVLANLTPGALNSVMDLNVEITRKYTNSRYFEEARGIADGAKVSIKPLLRMNILPELIKAACTVAGVWKQASEKSKTLHMRALDWDAANPINKYPIITVYHPSDKKLHKHANIAWIGFIGSLTGISQKVSIGQKVWLAPKNSVKMTRFGNPWTYVLRDILYDAENMSQALSILTNARRTCAIHLGLASTDDHSFRMLEYSQNILNNYDDKNYTSYNSTSHPKAPGIAYFDKHVQPSHDDCVGSLLTNSKYYGKWTAEQFWRVVGLSHKTGDTQLVVFDLEDQKAYVSYSRSLDSNQTENAYLRSPFEINLENLWADF